MNKKKKIILIIILVLATISLIIFVVKLFLGNKLQRVGKTIELDTSSCKFDYYQDTHGGFLGDGDYFAKITCSKINYDKLSSNWKELPLSEPLDKVLNMKKCLENGCYSFYEEFSIPDITKGYYYFMDRHSESKNKYDDHDLNNRASWNFTLAIIDRDTNIIYYFELDT